MNTECKGKNCTAINGVDHSKDCIAEHEITTNPEFKLCASSRYKGYVNEPLDENPSRDQLLSWDVGKRSREPR